MIQRPILEKQKPSQVSPKEALVDGLKATEEGVDVGDEKGTKVGVEGKIGDGDAGVRQKISSSVVPKVYDPSVGEDVTP